MPCASRSAPARVAAANALRQMPSTSRVPAGLERPQRVGEWWSVSEEEWEEAKPRRRALLAHAGEIMEGDHGVLSSNRCLRLVLTCIFDHLLMFLGAVASIMSVGGTLRVGRLAIKAPSAPK